MKEDAGCLPLHRVMSFFEDCDRERRYVAEVGAERGRYNRAGIQRFLR
jgi:hypothetical protein